ncbi:MAG: hypothetical protein ACN2B6_00275 [Rickettsiales bacterium]
MRPFKLEAALAGAKLVTRDGSKVEGFHKRNIGHGVYPYSATIVHNKRELVFTSEGKYEAGDTEYDEDLFLAEDRKYFDTFQEALAAAPGCDCVVTTGPKWDEILKLKGKFAPCCKTKRGELKSLFTGGLPALGESAWVICPEQPPELDLKVGLPAHPLVMTKANVKTMKEVMANLLDGKTYYFNHDENSRFYWDDKSDAPATDNCDVKIKPSELFELTSLHKVATIENPVLCWVTGDDGGESLEFVAWIGIDDNYAIAHQFIDHFEVAHYIKNWSDIKPLTNDDKKSLLCL